MNSVIHKVPTETASQPFGCSFRGTKNDPSSPPTILPVGPLVEFLLLESSKSQMVLITIAGEWDYSVAHPRTFLCWAPRRY